MEFAIVNNYMGQTATKIMKGYSDENVQDTQTNGSGSTKVKIMSIVMSAVAVFAFFFLYWFDKCTHTHTLIYRAQTIIPFFSFFCHCIWNSGNPLSIGHRLHRSTIHSVMDEPRPFTSINSHVSSFHSHLSSWILCTGQHFYRLANFILFYVPYICMWHIYSPFYPQRIVLF